MADEIPGHAKLPSPAAADSQCTPPKQADGQAIGHAAVVVLFTRIASVALAWALEVVLVRMVTPSEWNGMSRFLTLAGAFGIAQFGFPESVLYFAAKTGSVKAGLKLTLRTSVLLAGIGALLGAFFLIFPWLAERALGDGAVPLLTPLMLFVITDLAFSPLPSFLLARQEPRLASMLSFGTRIPIAISVIVAISLGLPLSTALHFMAFGSLISLLAGWALVLYATRDPHSQRSEEGADGVVSVAEQTKFSVPVGLTKLVQIANVKLDKYVVLMVFSEAVFGSYYLGAAEFPVPSLICGAVMSIMMADLVRHAAAPDRSELLSLWHASIEKIALIVLPIFVFMSVFADQIFVLIYGAAHESAAIQFRIFNTLILARVTNYTFISLALNQPRVPFTAAAIALVMNVRLSLIFVRTLGLIGPAVANVTAIYLSTIYTMYAIRKALNVPWSRLFPLRRYLTTLVMASVAGVPAASVLLLKLPPLATLILAAVIHVTLFMALASASKLLTPSDKEFLWSVLKLGFLKRAKG